MCLFKRLYLFELAAKRFSAQCWFLRGCGQAAKRPRCHEGKLTNILFAATKLKLRNRHSQIWITFLHWISVIEWKWLNLNLTIILILSFLTFRYSRFVTQTQPKIIYKFVIVTLDIVLNYFFRLSRTRDYGTDNTEILAKHEFKSGNKVKIIHKTVQCW